MERGEKEKLRQEKQNKNNFKCYVFHYGWLQNNKESREKGGVR